MKTRNENMVQTMQTLYNGIVRAVERGYNESYNVISWGLTSPDEKCIYNSSDDTILNLYKGQPQTAADGSKLYLMKTVDGRKGALVKSRKAPSDISVSSFVEQVYSTNRTGKTREFWFNFL